MSDSGLPPGVAEVRCADRRVFLRLEPGADPASYLLSACGARWPFRPVSDAHAEARAPSATLPLPLGSPPLVNADDSPADAQLITDSKWALAGVGSIQMRCRTPSEPRSYRINGVVALPPHDGHLEFTLLAAQHRALGEVQVWVHGASAGNDEPAQLVGRAALPAEAAGGPHESDYHRIRVPLPASEVATVVRCAVSYQAPRADSSETDPFIFLSSPEVVSTQQRRASVTPLRYRGAGRTGESWCEACIDRFAQRSVGPVELVCHPADPFPLYEISGRRVVLLHSDGNVLTLRADVADEYTVSLDGVPVMVVAIDTSPTEVCLPFADRASGLRYLQVTDRACNEVLFETYLAPFSRMEGPDTLRDGHHVPVGLAPRDAHRYRALKSYALREQADALRTQLPHLLETLEGTHSQAVLSGVRFPDVEAPTVSVVIPTFGKCSVTYYALCALALAGSEASFEVIVVDDGAGAGFDALERAMAGVRVVRLPAQSGFIAACNAGVGMAKGRYLALLNNDTEVTSGWLDALVDAFQRFPGVGLAGSRLLWPDGTLQDAGGIVWGNGNPAQCGWRQSAGDPRYGYARQADYLSGAALMTTREVWDAVGGLSDYLAPMYFEDTDLAFKVREAGYATWYVPASVVYHFEGLTSGRDETQGPKRYQARNRPKFKRRWAQAFGQHGRQGSDPDLEKDRAAWARVLMIDKAIPRPDRSAGGHAACQEIALLQSLGCKVTFVPADMVHLGAYTESLQSDGVEVVYSPYHRSAREFIEQRGAEFDLVYITRHDIAQPLVEAARAANPTAPIVLNLADLHYLRALRAARVRNNPQQIEQAHALKRRELATLRSVDLVLTYSTAERDEIQTRTNGAVKTRLCPWVAPVADVEGPGFADRDGLTFIGGFRHHPNVEGVEWFAERVLPALAQQRADIALSVYGSEMPGRITDLATDNLEPMGFVPDLEAAFSPHRVFVAPLLSGAGVKGKVVSALAHGIPAVLSPVAMEGIGLETGKHCLLAETPEQWVAAITSLHEDPRAWAAMSAAARAFVAEHYGHEQGRAQMRDVLEAVDLFSPTT